jgi:hypothetical protein
MSEILLRNSGRKTLVDASDLTLFGESIWHEDNYGYAVRREWVRGGKGKQVSVKLHRLIIGAKPGQFVDHINRNRLDNRKSNLRITTHAQNLWNASAKKNNTSGFKGVSVDKRRLHQKYPYKAEIMVNRKKVYLGSFSTAQEASLAYNEAAKKYFGEFACLNPVRDS